MTAHAPNSAARKSSQPKHNPDEHRSSNTVSIARPVLQELPKNGPRPTSIFIPDKNSKKTNAMKQMRRLSKADLSVAPVVPCAPMVPTRLPSPEASDHEELRMSKKRKLDDGRNDSSLLHAKQTANELIGEFERLFAAKTAGDGQIDKLRKVVEAAEQSNRDLQQKNCALTADLETCRSDLRKEKEERAQQHDDTFREISKLDRQCNESAQRCEKLRTELEECRADHAVTESGLLEDKRILEARLKSNQDQMKELHSLHTTERSLRLANEDLRTRTSKLEEEKSRSQTSVDEQAQNNTAQKVQLDKQRQESLTREQMLITRIDELIRTNTSLKANLVAERDVSEKAIAVTKKFYEGRLGRAEEAAEASRQEVQNVTSRLSRLQAECKQKEIDLHMMESNMKLEARQIKLDDRAKREQLQLVTQLVCDSHARASRSLLAALNGIEAERRVAGAVVLAECAAAQEATKAVAKLKQDLRISDERLVALDAHKNELFREYKRELDDKTAEETQLRYKCQQLELQLTTAKNDYLSRYDDELRQRDARLDQQDNLLKEMNLAISHQRKCQIATKWHSAAIKAQRAAASSECDAQRQEVDRLSELLHIARSGCTTAESAKAEIERKLQDAVTLHVTTEAQLTQLAEQKSRADDELRALRDTAGSHTETLKALETCTIQLKWLDDKYQETFDANRSLNDTIADLRTRLASTTVPLNSTTSRGTDPVQNVLTIDTAVQAVPEQRKGLPSRQPLTPQSSVSTAPPTPFATESESRSLSCLRTDVSADTGTHQLLTPITPSIRFLDAQKAVPTQPRNFAMERELLRRRQQEDTSKDHDLFPDKQTRALPPPPKRGKSVPKRPFYDSYRP